MLVTPFLRASAKYSHGTIPHITKIAYGVSPAGKRTIYRKMVAKTSTVIIGRNSTHRKPSAVCLYCTRISFFTNFDKISRARHKSPIVSFNPRGFWSITVFLFVFLGEYLCDICRRVMARMEEDDTSNSTIIKRNGKNAYTNSSIFILHLWC